MLIDVEQIAVVLKSSEDDVVIFEGVVVKEVIDLWIEVGFVKDKAKLAVA